MKYIISGLFAITMLFAVYIVTSFNDIVVVKNQLPEESEAQHVETEPYESEYEEDEVIHKVDEQLTPPQHALEAHDSDDKNLTEVNTEESVVTRTEADVLDEQALNADTTAESAPVVAIESEANSAQISDALIEAEASNTTLANDEISSKVTTDDVPEKIVEQPVETVAEPVVENKVVKSPSAPVTKSLHQPTQEKPLNLMTENDEGANLQVTQEVVEPTVAEEPEKIETPIAELTEKMIQWPSGKQRRHSKTSSYKELFGLWDLNYNSAKHGSPCVYAIEQGFSCHRDRSDLESLREFNRPAVLTLYDDANHIQYATLKEINENEAKLVIAGKEQVVSLSQLERYWNGDYQFFWTRPEGYFQPIMPGDSGRAVLWLSRRMLKINNHLDMTPHDYYDDALMEQIKAFQLDHGLDNDGIVGLKTLIHINQATSKQVPLLESS